MSPVLQVAVRHRFFLQCFGMFYDGGVGGGPGGPEGGVVPPAAEGHGGGLARLPVPGRRVSRGGRRTTH